MNSIYSKLRLSQRQRYTRKFACCQIEFHFNNTGQVPTENLIGIIIICFILFQLFLDI